MIPVINRSLLRVDKIGNEIHMNVYLKVGFKVCQDYVGVACSRQSTLRGIRGYILNVIRSLSSNAVLRVSSE